MDKILKNSIFLFVLFSFTSCVNITACKDRLNACIAKNPQHKPKCVNKNNFKEMLRCTKSILGQIEVSYKSSLPQFGIENVASFLPKKDEVLLHNCDNALITSNNDAEVILKKHVVNEQLFRVDYYKKLGSPIDPSTELYKCQKTGNYSDLWYFKYENYIEFIVINASNIGESYKLIDLRKNLFDKMTSILQSLKEIKSNFSDFDPISLTNTIRGLYRDPSFYSRNTTTKPIEIDTELEYIKNLFPKQYKLEEKRRKKLSKMMSSNKNETDETDGNIRTYLGKPLTYLLFGCENTSYLHTEDGKQYIQMYKNVSAGISKYKYTCNPTTQLWYNSEYDLIGINLVDDNLFEYKKIFFAYSHLVCNQIMTIIHHPGYVHWGLRGNYSTQLYCKVAKKNYDNENSKLIMGLSDAKDKYFNSPKPYDHEEFKKVMEQEASKHIKLEN